MHAPARVPRVDDPVIGGGRHEQRDGHEQQYETTELQPVRDRREPLVARFQRRAQVKAEQDLDTEDEDARLVQPVLEALGERAHGLRRRTESCRGRRSGGRSVRNSPAAPQSPRSG